MEHPAGTRRSGLPQFPLPDFWNNVQSDDGLSAMAILPRPLLHVTEEVSVLRKRETQDTRDHANL